MKKLIYFIGLSSIITTKHVVVINIRPAVQLTILWVNCGRYFTYVRQNTFAIPLEVVCIFMLMLSNRVDNLQYNQSCIACSER